MAENLRYVGVEWDQPIASDNTIVFSAATKDQVSTSWKEMKHGLFTYYLLKALRNGKESFGELESYLREEVPKKADQLSKIRQEPKLQGIYNTYDMILK